MEKASKYILNTVLIFVLGFAVFYFIFKSDVEAIVEVLENANSFYILLALFMVLLWLALAGIILTIFTRIFKASYSYKKGCLNASIASFFHCITPGASGGQIAQLYIFHLQDLDELKASSVLLLDFIVYQLALCFISFILILLRFKTFIELYSNVFYLALIGFMLSLSIVIILLFLMKSERLHDWICHRGTELAYKWHLIKNPVQSLEKYLKFFATFRKDVEILSNNRRILALTFVLNSIRLLIFFSIPFVLFVANGISFDFKIYIDSVAMSAFISMVSGLWPIPGATGGAELSFTWMFSKIFNEVIVKSTLFSWRFLTYYFTMFIGFLAFIYIKIRSRSFK